MTLLIDLINAYKKNFDDETYPPEIYFHLLDRVQEAKSPEELGSALVHLISWKDGKVRRDAAGPHKTQRPNVSYTVKKPKPNTLGSRHEDILKSKRFFDWASKLRTTQKFDADLILDLTKTFGLWKSVVIPAFLVHCLRPQIYPIVDRYVIVVYNIFQPDANALRADPLNITAKAYNDYHSWWLRVMNEAGIQPLAAEINQLKDIDSGIWSLGKYISLRAKEIASIGDEMELQSNPDTGDAPHQHDDYDAHRPSTKSPEFRKRVIEIWKKGKGSITQTTAIKKAADEMGITLKGSYIAYPGSHFDRWRRQGYLHD